MSTTLKEIANDLAKDINKITAPEGTNDDYGVDDIIDNGKFHVMTYTVSPKGKLLSVCLHGIVHGFLVCINTSGGRLSVGEPNENAITVYISDAACNAINEYYCPPFARY